MSDSENANTGLELDKIDISIKDSGPDASSKLSKPVPPPKSPLSVETNKTEPEDEEYTETAGEVQHQKKSKRLIFLMISAVALVVLLALFIFFGVFFSFSTSSSSSAVKPPSELQTDFNTSIGPIIINSKDTGSVKLKITISINCKNSKLKKQIIQKNPNIIERLQIYLKSPSVEQMISNRDYITLKTKMKNRINDMLGTDSIDEIYFSELIVY